MGIVELLKSIVGKLIRFFPGEIRSPGETDYDEVLKNHRALMNAYGSVRKRVSKTPVQIFYRSLFVESHIYKRMCLAPSTTTSFFSPQQHRKSGKNRKTSIL
jgi:hypothetical protein